MITIEVPFAWFEKNHPPESIKPLLTKIDIDGQEHTLVSTNYKRIGSGVIAMKLCSRDEMELRRIPGLEGQLRVLEAKLRKYEEGDDGVK